MRIVAGEFKGRVLELPPHSSIRPTSERVREAIFSALQSQLSLEGVVVVDLYAGTGALGLEALSRGARAAVFVEKNKQHAGTIHKNIALLGVDERAVVIEADVSHCFEAVEKAVGRFQAVGGKLLMLADPPYEEHPGAQLLELALDSEVFGLGSILVVEAPIVLDISPRIDAKYQGSVARLIKTRAYGDTQVLYYVIGSNEQSPE